MKRLPIPGIEKALAPTRYIEDFSSGQLLYEQTRGIDGARELIEKTKQMASIDSRARAKKQDPQAVCFFEELALGLSQNPELFPLGCSPQEAHEVWTRSTYFPTIAKLRGFGAAALEYGDEITGVDALARAGVSFDDITKYLFIARSLFEANGLQRPKSLSSEASSLGSTIVKRGEPGPLYG